MKDETMERLANLHRQIESRTKAMAQVIASEAKKKGGRGKKGRRTLASASRLKGVVMKVSKSTGKCSCHDRDTGDRFQC